MQRPILAFVLAVASACDSADRGADAGSPDAGPPDAGPMRTAVCTEPTPPSCVDEQILELALYAEPNLAAIENTPDGDGWLSHVDATAGGFSPTQSYVYARFTNDGLVRVDIGDEEAFDSMEWDIAFRRFVIRLNSGVSGPSCVGAFRAPAGADYDTLAPPPDDTEYRVEQYFTEETCEIVPDGSGLGSPGTALQSFWQYPGCVQMTGNVYVIRLANGRRLKLTVTAFYEPSYQRMCQDTGSVEPGVNGAGNIRLRWQFLDP
ncbi:MAG TPA: HmuY family protein [Sandaracinaceae bacterium]